MKARAGRRTLISDGPERTRAFAEALAERLSAGSVISLVGNLGAGKTVFVQGLARGLGCRHNVCSPTFVLLRVYSGGRLPLYHVDAYRLRDASDLSAAGIEELLAGDGVTAVEWGDRVDAAMPASTLKIEISHSDRDTERIITWDSPDPGILRLTDACWLDSHARG